MTFLLFVTVNNDEEHDSKFGDYYLTFVYFINKKAF